MFRNLYNIKYLIISLGNSKYIFLNYMKNIMKKKFKIIIIIQLLLKLENREISLFKFLNLNFFI
jgi:hypothetical protein